MYERIKSTAVLHIDVNQRIELSLSITAFFQNGSTKPSRQVFCSIPISLQDERKCYFWNLGDVQVQNIDSSGEKTCIFGFLTIDLHPSGVTFSAGRERRSALSQARLHGHQPGGICWRRTFHAAIHHATLRSKSPSRQLHCYSILEHHIAGGRHDLPKVVNTCSRKRMRK